MLRQRKAQKTNVKQQIETYGSYDPNRNKKQCDRTKLIKVFM